MLPPSIPVPSAQPQPSRSLPSAAPVNRSKPVALRPHSFAAYLSAQHPESSPSQTQPAQPGAQKKTDSPSLARAEKSPQRTAEAKPQSTPQSASDDNHSRVLEVSLEAPPETQPESTAAATAANITTPSSAPSPEAEATHNSEESLAPEATPTPAGQAPPSPLALPLPLPPLALSNPVDTPLSAAGPALAASPETRALSTELPPASAAAQAAGPVADPAASPSVTPPPPPSTQPFPMALPATPDASPTPEATPAESTPSATSSATPSTRGLGRTLTLPTPSPNTPPALSPLAEARLQKALASQEESPDAATTPDHEVPLALSFRKLLGGGESTRPKRLAQDDVASAADPHAEISGEDLATAAPGTDPFATAVEPKPLPATQRQEIDDTPLNPRQPLATPPADNHPSDLRPATSPAVPAEQSSQAAPFGAEAPAPSTPAKAELSRLSLSSANSMLDKQADGAVRSLSIRLPVESNSSHEAGTIQIELSRRTQSLDLRLVGSSSLLQQAVTDSIDSLIRKLAVDQWSLLPGAATQAAGLPSRLEPRSLSWEPASAHDSASTLLSPALSASQSAASDSAADSSRDRSPADRDNGRQSAQKESAQREADGQASGDSPARQDERSTLFPRSRQRSRAWQQMASAAEISAAPPR